MEMQQMQDREMSKVVKEHEFDLEKFNMMYLNNVRWNLT